MMGEKIERERERFEILDRGPITTHIMYVYDRWKKIWTVGLTHKHSSK